MFCSPGRAGFSTGQENPHARGGGRDAATSAKNISVSCWATGPCNKFNYELFILSSRSKGLSLTTGEKTTADAKAGRAAAPVRSETVENINKHPDINSWMSNNDESIKRPFAVRKSERTSEFTCREPPATARRMVGEEEAVAAAAFISCFTSLQTVFRLRLLLGSNDGHHSSMSAHYRPLGSNHSPAETDAVLQQQEFPDTEPSSPFMDESAYD